MARAMTAALSESDLPFRELADHSSHGILIHDGARPLFVNPACARLLGFADARSARAQLDLARHFRPDDLGKLEAEWRRMLAGHQTASSQRQRLRALDGRMSWVALDMRATRWQRQPAIQMILREDG